MLRPTLLKIIVMITVKNISECLTLPHGDDLDQVIVGEGRYRHRQHFDKAYRVGNLIGR